MRGARLAKPGKSKPEIIRCLERYVARELYSVLVPAALPIRPIREANITLLVTGVA